MTPVIGCVVLTQGTRPDDLARGLASLLAQRDVTCDIVVVGNGWQPSDLPAGVRGLALPDNVGIPAGRNAGVPLVAGDLLFFLDDDASLPDPQFLAELSRRFAHDATLGLVQPRVVDPTGLPAPRRWVPRLRVGDPARPGPAMALWEGAVMIRRTAFDWAGGWPDAFFYAHEGIDLAWRVWDGDWVTWYAGDLVAHHPAIQPTRHAEFYRLNARNRVWLARRNLRLPLGIAYVSTWIVLTVLRTRSTSALRMWFSGLREGLRVDPGGRRPMRWSTVWRMTRAGRPPVV